MMKPCFQEGDSTGAFRPQVSSASWLAHSATSSLLMGTIKDIHLILVAYRTCTAVSLKVWYLTRGKLFLTSGELAGNTNLFFMNALFFLLWYNIYNAFSALNLNAQLNHQVWNLQDFIFLYFPFFWGMVMHGNASDKIEPQQNTYIRIWDFKTTNCIHEQSFFFVMHIIVKKAIQCR